MAKVQQKSEKISAFGGIFFVLDRFDRILSSVIDSHLGLRSKLIGYQYSEIIRAVFSVFCCGGDCVEDVTSHLIPHLSLDPTLRTCSSDTILRGISELATANTTYTSDIGKNYDFNTAPKLNSLLVKALTSTGQLVAGESYDMDFDHQFIETEKYDAKMTYKKFTGYSPGVAVIGDLIVGIENRDGNANVRFHQQDTLERIFSNLEQNGIHIRRARMDCGSCSREIVETIERHSEHFYIRANRCASLYDSLLALRGWKKEEINGIEYELNSITVEKWEGKAYRLVIQRERRTDGERDLWEGEYTYRYILTNDYTSTNREIVEFYNLRGGKERILDDMNNGFGWARLPKSFMAENTVFLLLTALIRNFYKFLMDRLDTKAFGLKKTSRIKAFVFKFISVPAKWIRTARHYELNIYTHNKSYQAPFALTGG
ncbi:MAG: IS1380 family transposase [Prevotella sp.]|nr:IS1380 family transposase [Prevotella sp.]